MIAPRRLERMQAILDQRLGWVHCAVEHVHHRHNVSAILRTCDALGLFHVHLVGEQTFQVVGATSRGAHRWLNIQRHPTVGGAVRAIKDAGCRLLVADLADDAVAPREVPIDQPVCLWFGAELVGVDPEAREAADGVVTIPMHGMAQSLNVSVASALALEPVAHRARHGVDGALLDGPTRAAVLTDWLAREAHDDAATRQLADALRADDPTPSG